MGSVQLPRRSFEDGLTLTVRWLRDRWETQRNSFLNRRDPGFQFSIRSVIQSELHEFAEQSRRSGEGGVVATKLPTKGTAVRT